MQQNGNSKNNTLKIILIIIGSIIGLAVIGIVGIFLLFSLLKTNIETNLEQKEEISEKTEEKNTSEDYSENNSTPEEKEEEASSDNENVIQEYSNITQISLSTFNKMITNKESFVIVVSQTHCSHCIKYKPIFNEVLSENNIIGYEIDLLTMSKSDKKDFINLVDISGTPTTLVYIDGVLQDEKIEGSTEKNKLLTFLQKYKLTK